MGLFNKIFNSNEEESQKNQVPWVKLTSVDQLSEAVELSNKSKVVLFKHSTRCNISASALHKFTSKWTNDTDVIPFYLDLIEHRDISNKIAEQFGVAHQSPQAMVIKEGKVIYDASHMSINLDDITSL